MLEALSFITGNLIEIMGAVLCFALALRFVAYKTGRQDKVYFDTFTSSVEKILHNEEQETKTDNVSLWLHNILNQVVEKLPKRGLRSSTIGEQQGSFRHQGSESFQEFAHGKRSIVHSVKSLTDAFKSPYPPNFSEMTNRVLEQDRRWQNVFGFIPVDTLSRMLDILPGLFVVGGIFGTFIGITSALPVIATIDLSHLEEATPVLNKFVANVAYSMNTSISGIIYSVTLTLLNALFPIQTDRIAVKKGLERCFQLLWSRIHGGEMSSAERKMVILLNGIYKSVSKPNPENQEYRQAS